MSVYVDNARHRYGRMVMSHMVADTTAELLGMADRIGVDRRWLQKPGTPTEHFDVCQAKREQAAKLGALLVSQRDLFAVIRRKRAATLKIAGYEGMAR